MKSQQPIPKKYSKHTKVKAGPRGQGYLALTLGKLANPRPQKFTYTYRTEDMKSQDKKSQEKLRTSSKKLNTRKSIKTNLELLKKNIHVENEKLKEQSRNAGRNTTPLKSKETTGNHKSLNDTKVSDRRSKRSVKSRKQQLREEVKEETKQTTRSVLAKQHKDVSLKCGECGDIGFKDAKQLTKHQHKYWKAYKRWKNCEKLLKADDYDAHLTKKCRKKTVIKNADK